MRALAAVALLAALPACGPSPTQIARDLASTDPARRVAGLEALDGEPQRAAALAALADDDAGVRASAVRILAAVEDPAERTSLVQQQLATGEHTAAMLEAVRAWGPGAAPALDAAAQHLQDPEQRALATVLAWEFEPSRSSATVIGPLLDQIAAAPSTPIVTTKDLSRHPDALPYLASRAADPNPRVRRAVATWLGGAGDAAATPLVGLLGDPDLGVRKAAVIALGPLADARIAPALIGVLEGLRELKAQRKEETLEQLGAAAEAAAGASGDEAALADLPTLDEVRVDMSAEEPLENALREALVQQSAAAVRPLLLSDALLPLEATDVLRRIGAAAIPELLAVLAEPPADDDDLALTALRDLPDPRSIEPLIAILQRKGAPNGLAAPALMNIGAPAAPRCASLLGAPQGELRRACLTIVAETKDPAHFPALRSALADRDPWVASTAAAELGELRDTGAFDALVHMLRHPEHERRQAAAHALGKLRDARAAQPLISAIARLDQDPSADAEPAPLRIGNYESVCTPGDERYSEPEYNAGGNALVELGAPAVPAIVAALAAKPRAPAAARLLDALAQMPKARDAEGVVASLQASLKATDAGERAAAARGLVALRPAGWLDLLLEHFALEQGRGRSGGQALGDFIMALGNSKAERAARALVTGAPRLRNSWTNELVFTALAASQTGPAQAFLDERLQAGDLEAVSGGHEYYIRRAPVGAEAALIAALDRDDDDTLELACVLVNSGNDKLEAAARRWAGAAGYTVTKSVFASGGARWGSAR